MSECFVCRFNFVFSNLGAAIGNRLRGDKQSTPRIFYFASDIIAHVIGVSLCFLIYFQNPFRLLDGAVMIYLVSGFYFLRYRNAFHIEDTAL